MGGRKKIYENKWGCKMTEAVIIMAVTIGIILAIVLCQKPVINASADVFDRHTTNTLKGAAILLVFIHHWGYLTSKIYYDHYEHSILGYLAVTVFLFVAGYVTQFQYQKRGKIYVGRRFIISKLQRIYLPYVLVVILFAVIGRHEIGVAVKSIFNVTENWFLTAILVYYFIFFVIQHMIAEDRFRTKIAMWCISMIVYSVVCGMLTGKSVWYNTAWAFPIGIMAAYVNRMGENKVLKKIVFFPILICFIVSLMLAFFAIHYTVMSIVSSACLSVLLWEWGRRFHVKNKILEYIGTLSWEFYLIHVNVLYIVMDRTDNSIVIIALSFAITFVLALVFRFAVMVTDKAVP